MSNQRSDSSCAMQNILLRTESWAVRFVEKILALVFFVIFSLVVALVILRYVFNSTIIGGNEFTIVLFIYTTALGAAVDIARGKHIVVDTFVNYLPKGFRRWLEIFNLIIVGTLHGFLLKYSVDWISTVGASDNPVMHIPEGVIQIAMPIGCGLAVMFCITRIVFMLAENSAASE
jgi:TRAP-type C4-dicarboxylate transport system permease small subunit